MRKKISSLQKRKNNSSSKLWRTKADKAWGQIIHQDETCLISDQYCAGKLEAHHLISRAKVFTRHELINGVLLCSFHHKYSRECSPHMGPIGFADYLQHNEPAQYQWVLDNKWKTGKPDYKAAYERLMEVLDD
tara:strand:- start:907 stop:1305 length:399 start_codon:yes stop_codon:yes gene_type:complete